MRNPLNNVTSLSILFRRKANLKKIFMYTMAYYVKYNDNFHEFRYRIMHE